MFVVLMLLEDVNIALGIERYGPNEYGIIFPPQLF